MNFFKFTSYILKMAFKKKGDSHLFGEQIIEYRFNYLNQNNKSEILYFHNRLIINKLKK